MSDEIQRSVPRRPLADDAVKAFEAAPDAQGITYQMPELQIDTDPNAVGNMAAEAVASYIAAAQDIEAAVAAARKMAEEIAKDGTALAADLRRRGAAMEKMVANYAKLAAGTQQRMAEERSRLEEITGNGAP